MERRIEAASLAKHQMDTLEKLLGSGEVPALVDSSGTKSRLPTPIFEMLSDIVREIKQGHSIVMMPEDKILTTGAAADLLGVSRQHLVNLLESGAIDFHHVGAHRRVYFRDLKAYADRRDKSRKELLDELSRKVAKAGKYDASYQGEDG
jgi:excisionase family DNA binding protein